MKLFMMVSEIGCDIISFSRLFWISNQLFLRNILIDVLVGFLSALLIFSPYGWSDTKLIFYCFLGLYASSPSFSKSLSAYGSGISSTSSISICEICYFIGLSFLKCLHSDLSLF